jgi:predicted  nucleic acid-binding Zn-ribbon protein
VAVEADYEYGAVKKQIQTAEEEIQKAREARKRSQEQRMSAGGY